MRELAVIVLIYAVMCSLAACGGGSSSNPTATAPASATSAAGTPATGTTPAGDECTADEPPGLHSTTHEVDEPTTEQDIVMTWTAPRTDVDSYRYAFSQNPQEPPDQLESLAGDATEARSGPLGQNRWYFYLIETGADGDTDPVRCGPYVITRAGESGDDGDAGGSGDQVTLTIAVAGGSSVEYFTNQGERLFCGDTTQSEHEVTCSADFLRGSEARIQRTLGLSDVEEARWRLSGWGGACDGIDADTEPRGGLCTLLMDDDKDVSVSFEERAMITVTHTGPPQLLMRWSIDYRPAAQKGGGNPLTLRGEFDCDTDTLAACTKTAYFDTGTTIILRAGTGVDNGNLAGFSGDCSTSESTCEFTLDADAEVTLNWQY